ncbi:metallophosphoesterase [Moraxella macacae 0408225]|uniref:Metallophosphoesterase n=1 Tax=Moraxella macacae 0408225 TaxID=1230338 RepID=L2F8Z6_9GAMM|nr:metallophosphoesterase [Moraxella macacae]ELA09380.1 metallophosphoesterase [Moraxella macacae 0408225]
MIYDIIGDVHGKADKLTGLLTKLGYRFNGEFFVAPPNHQAIFIGDLVDRGEKQLATLNIVFNMIDNDQALAVMGNHEYNALAYATLDERNPTEYLRKHESKHTLQHQAFLDEVGFGTDLHDFWLQRFYELPLWLEFEQACFVHACWDTHAMSVLKQHLTHDNKLTKTALQLTSYQDTPEYNALERVLKGVEIPLPEGIYFVDKEKNMRHNMRVQWWLSQLSNQPIHKIARAMPTDLASVPVDALSEAVDFELTTKKPIFVGHYWLTGIPNMLSDQVVCVDYSAGGNGFLTAYRFDTNNPNLSAANFVQFLP